MSCRSMSSGLQDASIRGQLDVQCCKLHERQFVSNPTPLMTTKATLRPDGNLVLHTICTKTIFVFKSNRELQKLTARNYKNPEAMRRNVESDERFPRIPPPHTLRHHRGSTSDWSPLDR
jgi:hypothetical protein